MHEASPLGILGGTFDPVHFGHLRLAEEARTALSLSEVRWIPAGRPAHRAAPCCTAQHRLEMVRMAIAGNPAFTLDASEVHSAEPSYSVPTLERLRQQIGAQRPLVLVLGADAFLGLSSWHRWRDIFALAHLAVATRPGCYIGNDRMDAVLSSEFSRRLCHDAAALGASNAGSIFSFTITALDISATMLRTAFVAGESVRYLLPDPVLDYISSHQLYSN
ncbi:MAG TPA: nicotinate-nucleotide adenylyltransferase [Rhodocyclaceae bacterium]|nr:nicotinate-nucleotide adenylyltransferase [Rhodocyclaceae bacterium]